MLQIADLSIGYRRRLDSNGYGCHWVSRVIPPARP
jgi:hypothetical protein